MMNKWVGTHDESTPKCPLTPFIGITNSYPWPTLMVWNEHDSAWVYSVIGVCEMDDGNIDTWFENEQTKVVINWQALPDLLDEG